MNLETREWDPAAYLTTREDAIEYLDAILEETGDPAIFQAALGDVARAQGMSQVADTAGLGRESLYKSLRAESHPSFETISRVAAALGGRLAILPVNATVEWKPAS